MLQPVRDYILVEDLSPKGEQKSQMGILLPSDKGPFKRGKVIAMGKGYIVGNSIMGFPFSLDSVVLFRSDAGTDVKDKDKEYILLGYSDIYMVEK